MGDEEDICVFGWAVAQVVHRHNIEATNVHVSDSLVPWVDDTHAVI